jgi:hypothetical protein
MVVLPAALREKPLRTYPSNEARLVCACPVNVDLLMNGLPETPFLAPGGPWQRRQLERIEIEGQAYWSYASMEQLSIARLAIRGADGTIWMLLLEEPPSVTYLAADLLMSLELAVRWFSLDVDRHEDIWLQTIRSDLQALDASAITDAGGTVWDLNIEDEELGQILSE